MWHPFSSAPGSALSDFQQPFVGSLSSFDGLPYSHPTNFDMLDLLAGSGGGKWLDISSTGLAQVGYIRFSVPTTATPTTGLNFDLDAVSISHAALGAATVPEPATALLSLRCLPSLVAASCRRRRTVRSVRGNDLPPRRTKRTA